MAATLKCDTIQNASSSTANLTLDASGNATVGNTLVMGSSFKRNRIINGAMEISQRGTSFSSPSNLSYTLDRWKFWADGSGGTLVISQTALSPAELTPFSYAMRINQSVGATSRTYFRINQHIEGLEQFSGQTITVTFYAKCASGTVSANLRADRYFGTGGSPSSADNQTFTTGGTQTITTTWARYTSTATIASTSGKTYGTNNDSSLLVGIDLPSSGTFDVNITGVQVELGSVATPYEKQIYSEQLAQCQRYYETTYNVGVTPGSSSSIGARSFYSQDFSSRQYLVGSATFAVPKRATPNVTIYSPGGTSGAVWNSSDTNTGAGATANNIGVTAFRYINMVTTIVGALGTFTLHFVAEAEL